MKKTVRRAIIIFVLIAMIMISVVGCSKRKEFDIYIVHGTLPSLYAGLNIVSSGNDSYLCYIRTGTFDDSKLPNNVKRVWSSGQDSDVLEIQRMIARLSIENPNAYFNLYIDDIRVQWEIQCFTEYGISEDKYDVTLLSDGVGTYGAYLENLYAQDGTYSVWEEYAAKYVKQKNKAKNNEKTDLSSGVSAIDLAQTAVKASQSDNFEYWMQFPEYYTSKDVKVQNEIDKANIIKKEPNVMFGTGLTIQQKETFMQMTKVDKAVFDEMFNVSQKPDLIISGTSVAGSGNFTAYMQWIIDEYGDEYDLFFKPHPAYLPIRGGVINKDFLDNNSIVIMPGKLPMEALMWSYPNVKIGGYKSSLYMSVSNPDNVLFFLNMNGGSELVPPLDSLYNKGLFVNARFIIK